MTTTKQKVWLTLAGIHLLFVAAGAAQFTFSQYGMAGETLDLYGLWSGANSGYGFFAPGVGTGLRSEFDIIDKNGVTKIDKLETGQSREADIRVGNIVAYLSRKMEDEKARRSISASFAAKMFQKHPEARTVVVRLETIEIPTMQDYQKGVRYKWESLYRAKFVRKAAASE